MTNRSLSQATSKGYPQHIQTRTYASITAAEWGALTELLYTGAVLSQYVTEGCTPQQAKQMADRFEKAGNSLREFFDHPRGVEG